MCPVTVYAGPGVRWAIVCMSCDSVRWAIHSVRWAIQDTWPYTVYAGPLYAESRLIIIVPFPLSLLCHSPCTLPQSRHPATVRVPCQTLAYSVRHHSIYPSAILDLEGSKEVTGSKLLQGTIVSHLGEKDPGICLKNVCPKQCLTCALTLSQSYLWPVAQNSTRTLTPCLPSGTEFRIGDSASGQSK